MVVQIQYILNAIQENRWNPRPLPARELSELGTNCSSKSVCTQETLVYLCGLSSCYTASAKIQLCVPCLIPDRSPMRVAYICLG